MLPDVKDGRLLRKRVHDPPKLQEIDPDFGEEYDEAKHGEILRAELNISHLTPMQKEILTAVIKKYWRVFSKKGVTKPVKGYECEIDTGNAKPIKCKTPNFGPLETLWRPKHAFLSSGSTRRRPKPRFLSVGRGGWYQMDTGTIFDDI